jgi:hypothetical protein
MTTKRTAAEMLGKPPWTDDQLTQAYLSDFQGIRRALRSHPGYRPHAELEQLVLSKRLFDKAVTELKSAVDAFRAHSDTPGFRTPKTAAEFADVTLAVQSALFNTAATAIAYTNRARVIGHRMKVGGFVSKFKTVFELNERHHFIRELRDHFSHVAPLVAEWQLSWAAAGAPTVAKFTLEAADLDEAFEQDRQKWCKLAQKFIDSHRRSGVDIGLLFKDYGKDVSEFHDWLMNAAEVAGGSDLIAYRETEKRFYNIAFRMAWKTFVIPAMQQRNPRQVLDLHLTADEIAVVDQLPANSRDQVQRIISFLDPDQAFDDEIRNKIYMAFGVITE